MSEWKECKLADILELIGGGTPKTSVKEYWNGDIPWLSVVDFNNGRKFVHETEKSITKAGVENSSTNILQEGDIIISARGTVGVLAVLRKEMAFNQSCYGIRNIPDKSNKDFLYYLLKNTVDNFIQVAHGGVFDTITRSTFDDIKVKVPPLHEQKAIASVLGSLDDKIDLLHRQNQTLEAMAETLFRQWFIEEAEEDWEEYSVSDIADHKKETVKPHESSKKLFSHYSLPSFDDGKQPIRELGSGIRSNKYRVIPRSVLVSKLNPRFPFQKCLLSVRANGWYLNLIPGSLEFGQ